MNRVEMEEVVAWCLALGGEMEGGLRKNEMLPIIHLDGVVVDVRNNVSARDNHPVWRPDTDDRAYFAIVVTKTHRFSVHTTKHLVEVIEEGLGR